MSRDRLWTPGFIILWQSQLISTAGDAVYGIALGFWVLSTTGSTVLMGALMAASTLPGVLIAPFAGVLVDRGRKKALLIAMDSVRAAAVLLLAWMAFAGFIQVWMVFAAGILLSLCGAVFSPCVQSVIPELAPASRLTQANSAFSAVFTGSNLVGNTAGGFLYQFLGGPMLFLINGLSFLFSSLSLPFVRLPKTKNAVRPRFAEEMSDGFRFIMCRAGLRSAMITGALSSFLSAAAFTLLIPLCKFTPGLGSGRYGVLMACFSGGALIGYALLSAVVIKPKRRMLIFAVATFVHDALLAGFAVQPYFAVMAGMLIVAGVMNACFSVILLSTVQMSAPEPVRGKVMSFVNMLTAGVTPFAMAVGGVLGQALPIRSVISAAFLLSLAVTLPMYFSRSFRAFVTADYGAAGTAVPDSEPTK